jgi:hypothetical protein
MVISLAFRILFWNRQANIHKWLTQLISLMYLDLYCQLILACFLLMTHKNKFSPNSLIFKCTHRNIKVPDKGSSVDKSSSVVHTWSYLIWISTTHSSHPRENNRSLFPAFSAYCGGNNFPDQFRFCSWERKQH